MINLYSRKKRKRKLLFYLFVGLLLFFLYSKFTAITKSSELISPLPASGKHEVQSEGELGKIIQTVLEGSTGIYGIAIKNLKTNETYFQNEHKIFDSGSLYKIWVMAETLNQIKSGELKIDQVLSRDIKYLNEKFNVSPEYAELTEGSITLTVENALKQMITISHNYAALLLTEKVKLSSVTSFLQINGFKDSQVGTDYDSPKATPNDIALFFEKLYKGELADTEYTNKMLELLKMQKLNGKIPKNLPEGTIIAHKTGEIFYLTHDGGIVYTPKGDYIIVVMSDSDSPKGAEERIAKISEAVYKYFTSK